MAAWNVAARICRLVCIAAPDASTVKWYAAPATFQDAFQEIQIVEGVLMRFPSRQDRRSRSQRWNDAVQVLLDLQEEYLEWLDELPEGLRLAPGAQKLAAACKRDLKALRVELKPMEGS